MAAIQQNEESYFKTPSWKHAKNRILWLLVLMLSLPLSPAGNHHLLSKCLRGDPLLVAFIPMLVGTGGNCGAQSSTMVIQGLATDEIHLKDFFRVLFKECPDCPVVSLALAVVSRVRVILQYGDWRLALVMDLALICTVFVAKALGCIMPIFAQKYKVNPNDYGLAINHDDCGCLLVFDLFCIATAIFHL